MEKKIGIILMLLFVSLNLNGQIVVEHEGKVGIGRQDPQYLLDVEGGIVHFGWGSDNTTFGVEGDDPSLLLGTNGVSRGIIDLFGITAGAYSRIQTTDHNLHLDSPTEGKILFNYYKPGNVTLINPKGGFVGINTMNPTHELTVNGTIRAEEIIIDADVFPDYVFNSDYKLTPLNEVETYISQNGHLPGIPSEKEILKSGINMKAMNIKMMEKIEELTLYIIELEKKINKLNLQ